jgi:hypothetical protein
VRQLAAENSNQKISEKSLDTIAIDNLYKTACAKNDSRKLRKKMLMNMTHKEQTMKWQPCAAMYSLVCSLGQTFSATSIFGGRPGQQRSIDNRNIRH